MSEFRRRLMAVKKEELKENEVLAIHNINATGSATRLVGSSFSISNVVKMSINGVNITPTATYTFETTGDHEVRYTLKSTITSLAYFFSSCSRLTNVLYFNFPNVTNINKLFFKCSVLTTIENFNTPNVTSIASVFYGCNALLALPELPKNKYVTVEGAFAGCYKIKELPWLDTTNCNTFNQFAYNCRILASFPEYDTSNANNFNMLLQNANAVTTIPLLDFSKATSVYNMLDSCINLTNLGGFKGLKKDLSISYSSKLTSLSVHNIIEQAQGNFTLTLHATAKARWQNSEYYEADKAMATEKNITIQ